MTTTKTSLNLRFGGPAPSLSEQLKGLGIPVRELRQFDRDAVAITRLYIRGFLTASEARRARVRLTKKVGVVYNDRAGSKK